MTRITSALAVACAFAVSAGGATAAPLAGTFTLAGQAPVRVGTTYIDWGEVGPVFGIAPGSVGDIVFTSANGSFSGLTLTTGTLLDLTDPPASVGVPINIPNFLTADAQPTWDFTLTYVAPGAGTNAGCFDGNQATNCTPTGSPFTIIDTGPNAAVTMSMSGTVTDLVGPVSQWGAIYTTQFTNANAGDILSLLGTQGYVESSYSAQVTSTAPPPTQVPEPLSGLLLGAGLLLASTALRRRA
jgi:hypothetical protein